MPFYVIEKVCVLCVFFVVVILMKFNPFSRTQFQPPGLSFNKAYKMNFLKYDV